MGWEVSTAGEASAVGWEASTVGEHSAAGEAFAVEASTEGLQAQDFAVDLGDSTAASVADSALATAVFGVFTADGVTPITVMAGVSLIMVLRTIHTTLTHLRMLIRIRTRMTTRLPLDPLPGRPARR